MTTGRINQVATVVVAAGGAAARPNFRRPAARTHGVVVTRSAEPARSRSSRRTRTKTHVDAALNVGTKAPGRAAHRPKPPRPRSRAPVSLAFAAPVAGPEYSRPSGS